MITAHVLYVTFDDGPDIYDFSATACLRGRQCRSFINLEESDYYTCHCGSNNDHIALNRSESHHGICSHEEHSSDDFVALFYCRSDGVYFEGLPGGDPRLNNILVILH